MADGGTNRRTGKWAGSTNLRCNASSFIKSILSQKKRFALVCVCVRKKRENENAAYKSLWLREKEEVEEEERETSSMLKKVFWGDESILSTLQPTTHVHQTTTPETAHPEYFPILVTHHIVGIGLQTSEHGLLHWISNRRVVLETFVVDFLEATRVDGSFGGRAVLGLELLEELSSVFEADWRRVRRKVRWRVH